MLRRLLVAALAAVIAVPLFAAAPAAAVGSGDLFPVDAACGSGASDNCRVPIEWSTSFYGPAAGTHILRRTLFAVYAAAGEKILLGSSAVGVGTGDAVVWDPGLITDNETTALPVSSFSCVAQRATSGNGTRGLLDTRTKELAGARSVDGSGNSAGYEPCHYTAPVSGIYRVAFYGPSGPSAASGASPAAAAASISTISQPNPSTVVSAWDITVRPAGLSSVADEVGRVFTYVLAGFTGGNPRPTSYTTYLTTTDGFEYQVDTNGFDPNAFVFYGNRVGFYDADGVSPLNHDIVGTGTGQQTLSNPQGGVRIALPEYPLSLEPLADVTLTALGFPLAAVEPVLNPVTFTGGSGGDATLVGAGGTFSFETGTAGTYELIISRDGTSFDPGLSTNRVLRGVVAAGSHAVVWDGDDNAGNPFPVGNDYPSRATLRGGEYHAPMLDVESSVRGGPSITLQNPPNDVCPFSGVASDGTNCTRAFYDDRGYFTSSGVQVGTAGALLCSDTNDSHPAALDPSPAFADLLAGFDSTSTDRNFGLVTGSDNTNEACTGTFGDAKGLDLWTYFPSQLQSTTLDIVGALTDAVDDTATTVAGQAVTDDVQTNDVGDAPLATSGATDPANGSVTLASDGAYTYTPDVGFSGTDTFDYTLTAAGGTDTATVTITVTPDAIADLDTATAGQTATGNVLANDLGSAKAASAPSDPPNGSVVLAADGSYTYTPDAGFSGTDTFTYLLTANGGTDTATVTVVVSPDAIADVVAASTGQSSTGNVLTNDLATDGTVAVLTGPASGDLTLAADGSFTYTPGPGFSGSDSFTYTLSANGGTDTATVTITVAPVALDDAGSTDAGADATGNVLTNDLGTSRVASGATDPPNGSVTLAGSGAYTYTPDAGFSGTDTFDYTLTAAGGTDTATVTITVAPVAVADVDTTRAGADATGNVLTNDLGVTRTASAPSDPPNGSVVLAADGSYTYSPDAGFSGTDTFSYTLTADGGSDTAVVTITVAPDAVDDVVTGSAEEPASGNVLTNDLATDGTATVLAGPADGTLSLATDGSFTYTPGPGFSGTDTFTYTLTADGGTDTATVTISVGPVAVDDVATAAAGSDATGDVLGNDVGVALVASDPSNPLNGSVVLAADGTFTYTPDAGFSGTDTFTYTVSGDGGSDTGLVTVTVTPVAVDDLDTTVAGVATSGNVLTNDVGTDRAASAPSDPAHGSVVLDADGDYTYTPDAGFSGTDMFTYTLTADGGTDTATVVIGVGPVAVADTATSAAGQDATGNVLGNDVGVDREASGASTPADGTVVLQLDGDFTYTPDAGFSGTDTFTYTLTADGGTDTATVTVTVTPLGVDDAASTVAGTDATGDVLANDLGTDLVASAPSDPADGSVVLDPDGGFTYTPDGGFSGTDTFTYTVTGDGGTDTATVTITVGPVAVDDAGSTAAGQQATGDVLVNDVGVAPDASGASDPVNGSVTLASDGSWVYAPDAGFSGTDTFTYTLTADGGTGTATVTVTVTPVAVDDDFGGPANEPVTGAVLTNDLATDPTVTLGSGPTDGVLTLTAD
ncbi:MAG: hypothetical protein JWP95_1330, partial [Actinotalea sp.]|nr:hypothetical protein [Actinotalea sp.]